MIIKMLKVGHFIVVISTEASKIFQDPIQSNGFDLLELNGLLAGYIRNYPLYYELPKV